MASYLEDLTGKHISVNGVPFPDRKTLELTLPGAIVTDSPSRGSTAIAFEAGTPSTAPGAFPYTLALTDAGGTVESSSGSAVTVTVPLASSVDFPIGTIVFVLQKGTGTVTIAAAGGVTLRYLTGKGTKIVGQWGQAVLRKLAADEWLLSGEVGP